jgi:hypothetical protein
LRRLRQSSPECRDDALVRLAIGSAAGRVCLERALDINEFEAMDLDPRPWPDPDPFR